MRVLHSGLTQDECLLPRLSRPQRWSRERRVPQVDLHPLGYVNLTVHDLVACSRSSGRRKSGSTWIPDPRIAKFRHRLVRIFHLHQGQTEAPGWGRLRSGRAPPRRSVRSCPIAASGRIGAATDPARDLFHLKLGHAARGDGGCAQPRRARRRRRDRQSTRRSGASRCS